MNDQIGLVIYIVFFIGLVYLMIIRPQKKEKARKEQVMNALEKGAKVVSYSGIHGTVTSIDSEKGLIELNVAKGVDIVMEKAAVARVLNSEQE